LFGTPVVVEVVFFNQGLAQSMVRLAGMLLEELAEAKQLQVKLTQLAVTVLTELAEAAEAARMFRTVAQVVQESL
jgi:hypothetical protein